MLQLEEKNFLPLDRHRRLLNMFRVLILVPMYTLFYTYTIYTHMYLYEEIEAQKQMSPVR